MLPGLLLGPVIMLLTQAQAIPETAALLVVVGLCGGLFVVPLNALLQERGHKTVGAGHAVAIQNLFENLAMLGMVGLYTLSIKLGMDAIEVGLGFGGLVLMGLIPIAVARLWRTA